MRNVIKHKKLVWIDISNPTENDIRYLKNKYKIHPLTAKNIIPSIHYPDIDFFKTYLSFILHYPYEKESRDIKILEFDLVAGDNFVITSHFEETTPATPIFESCQASLQKKQEYMGKGTGYLFYALLNVFLKAKLEKINHITNEIDDIEEKIFSGQEKEMVRQISFLKMQIIDFWRIVEPQQTIFEALRIQGAKFFGEEYQHHFSQLYRIHRRLESSVKNSKVTIEALEETNHILVSLKMNEIIRILTIFSVIFMPLTLMASIWGMNTNYLLFQETGLDFFIILILMIITFSGMYAYFRLKKWI